GKGGGGGVSPPVELADHLVATRRGAEPDHIDEPAEARRPGRHRGEGHGFEPGEALAVPSGHALAAAEQLVEAVDLRGAEGGAQLLEAGVLAPPALPD